MEVPAPLELQREATMALVDSLEDVQLDAVHQASGWSVRDLFAHLARAELGVAFFLRQALDGQLIDMSLESRDAFNAESVEAGQGWSLGEIRQELVDAHESLAEAFAELAEPQLGTAITWPEWPAQTIEDSIPYMAAHEAEHVGQIREALGL